MRGNWIGTVILVGVSMAAGLLLTQIWDQVLGQVGFVEAPQVVVSQPAELPKCIVDFVWLPSMQGEMPRVRVITVVDTEAKRIAVYHSDMPTGQVRLLSVRDIKPDLMLNEHNATSPLPSEITRELQRYEGKK